MKKAQRNLKVLLSVGGYTYSQENHFNFISSATARANFVTSAIQLLEDNGLDGIDIDFEYPTAAQASDFATLLSQLRTGLDQHATAKGECSQSISLLLISSNANYTLVHRRYCPVSDHTRCSRRITKLSKSCGLRYEPKCDVLEPDGLRLCWIVVQHFGSSSKPLPRDYSAGGRH